MKATRPQTQPQAQSGSGSSPVIPPLLAEFARAVDAANASDKKMTIRINVETTTQDDDVNDQDDNVNDQDGENGKFFQLIY